MASTPKASNQTEQEILRELRVAGGSCRVSILAKRLGVSQETVRRNVKTLEKSAVVRKVHGGVHLLETVTEAPLDSRMDKQAAIKRTLAAAVAQTINDGDSLFLDIGSTTAYVALALREHSDLYIVTNSAFVANTLAARNNNRVFMAGGELRSHDAGAFGAEAIAFIQRFNVQYSIMSAGAVDATHGFMLHDLEEADVARVAIGQAQISLVVADSEKFDKRAPVTLDLSKNIDVLFTDQPPPKSIVDMLEKSDIDLVVTSATARN